MRRRYLPWYAAGLVAAIIGAVAVGVPLATVLLLLVVLACPMMMMFMMGGMKMGGGRDNGSPGTGDHRGPTAPPQP